MSDKSTKKPALGRAAAIGLSKEQIIAEAILLIDEAGLGAFSIRELSRRLKVYPAAIYWHVGGSKADLFGEISGGLTANLMPPQEVSPDWRETLRALFRRFRARLHEHPNAAPLLGAQMKSNGAPNAPWVEIILQALQQAGFEGQERIDAFNALVGGLEGFITMELGPAPEGSEDWADSFDERMNQLDPQEYPLLTASYPEMRNRAFVTRWRNGSDSPLDGGFELLLDTLILGLEARRAR
ncbi:TetR/AcrR family transcriptional regulator [Pseudooceanicola nanhaiensis]|uniref:TetR/AcrR family transcriptional regulator n=1 Tax=Pseudooceanicola nanhaiensis TaxID=375761 RepID=UPI001CD561F6|nr:TetR/AcrR family transcriptional regulator C-terminal domain-containing protein [Pseudooceanicola nanhaiensis]MCA0920898.1 TetR/AcrR family transcriptional regulator C-terminal domain-containing protein [Pseudooceanicola nanhaiensis]